MSDSAANPAQPRIGVAITTVGRWVELHKLFDDLSRQTQPPHAVAVAHHDATAADALDALVRSFADKLTISTVVSSRGISNGRNAAADLLGDDVDWIWFPNDTSRVDEDFLERVARHLAPGLTVCALNLVDREGSRNRLPAAGSPLTRRNIWGAIEPATIFRRADFVLVGGFDPLLGSGAETPWQAGEGTDLLLRLSKLDGFSIEWVPDIAVRAQTEFAHLTPAERARKLRSYGRGVGFVYLRWNYPRWQRLRYVLGGVLAPLRRPEKFRPRDGLALGIGRAEGVLGKVIPGEMDNRAILR